MNNITLKEAFNKKSVSELKEITSACRVKGYTKMRKAELVDVCSELVQSEGFFEEHALMIPEKAWNFFKKVAGSDSGITCKNILPEYAFSEKFGFLYVEKKEDGYWITIPEEIKSIYRELKKSGFLQAKEFSDLINNYAKAAVNLYGIISQDEFVEIFNSQNKYKVDIDTIFSVFIKHIYLDADYCLWDEYIVYADFEEDDFEGAERLIRETANKPRYIPGKSEFLKYADWTYYENTKQMKELSRFLVDECNVPNTKIEKLMFDLHWKFTESIQMQECFDILESYNVILSEEQVSELVPLMMDCCNNTRSWLNKGHTPNELSRLRRNSQQRSIKKIGRNDPCPCGSGKKYKKCCMLK